MAKTSAGILLYRFRQGALEILLVHPGGPYWARKDAGSWSLPKGEIGADEDPLEAAKREFAEETGIAPNGRFLELEPVKQAGGKVVHAWALEGDLDPERVRSNTFSIEWPPGSGRYRSFPEVDRAAWFPLEVAREKIMKGQLGLLAQLERALARRTDG